MIHTDEHTINRMCHLRCCCCCFTHVACNQFDNVPCSTHRTHIQTLTYTKWITLSHPLRSTYIIDSQGNFPNEIHKVSTCISIRRLRLFCPFSPAPKQAHLPECSCCFLSAHHQLKWQPHLLYPAHMYHRAHKMQKQFTAIRQTWRRIASVARAYNYSWFSQEIEAYHGHSCSNRCRAKCGKN